MINWFAPLFGIAFAVGVVFKGIAEADDDRVLLALGLLVVCAMVLGKTFYKWARDIQPQDVSLDDLTTVVCIARNHWGEQYGEDWLEDKGNEVIHPDEYIAQQIHLYLTGGKSNVADAAG